MTNFNRNDFPLFINISSSSTFRYDSIINNSLLSSSFDGKITSVSEQLKLVERLTTHITLIVSIIGLIGNGCTIVVLNRQSMRKWRSSILLTSLAIVDFLYLFIIFLSIIDELTNQTIGLNRSLILCQVTVYITHVCSFLSANFTLSFTLQRFVAVTFPLHAHTVISHRSSIINIAVLLILGCSFYSFSFFLTNVSHGQCREDEQYPPLFPLLIVDTCLTFVFPFTFIFIFNCAIVYNLRRRKKLSHAFDGSSIKTSCRNRSAPLSKTSSGTQDQVEQQPLNQTIPETKVFISLENEQRLINKSLLSLHKFSAMSDSTPKNGRYLSHHVNSSASTLAISSEALNNLPISNNQQAISQRTTKMLVICSTTFLLFNSPYCAVLLYSIISKVVLTRTLGILRHFYFMSFCLNFFLYSLWGNRFRQEFISLMQTCCLQKKIDLPWSTVSNNQKQSHYSRTEQRLDI